jgi:hypothetical protein
LNVRRGRGAVGAQASTRSSISRQIGTADVHNEIDIADDAAFAEERVAQV